MFHQFPATLHNQSVDSHHKREIYMSCTLFVIFRDSNLETQFIYSKLANKKIHELVSQRKKNYVDRLVNIAMICTNLSLLSISTSLSRVMGLPPSRLTRLRGEILYTSFSLLGLPGFSEVDWR